MRQEGSVLVVGIGFMLAFTAVGLSALRLAGHFNLNAETRRFSQEAFWLADAGVEEAKNKLQKASPILVPETRAPVSLGEGTYDVVSVTDPGCVGCIDRWKVDATGTVEAHTRSVEAVVARYDIDKVLETQGYVRDLEDCPTASVTVDCSLIEERSSFTIESVLNGLTQSDIVAAASHIYNDPQNAGDVDPIENVTVIYLTGNNSSLSITTDNQTGPAFLLIDTSGVTSTSTPTINIAGNPAFYGVIWIIGEVELKGTATINGSIFVQGDPNGETKMTGNLEMNFDPAAIDASIGTIGAPSLNTPQLISWKEL